MAAVILDRDTMPIGRLRREFIYVNNVVDGDTVKSTMSSIFAAEIKPANLAANYTQQTSVDFALVNNLSTLTIHNPSGNAAVIFEIEVYGQ